MKIGVSSYCFSNLVNCGDIKQIEVISKAKELGFDVIEFISFVLEKGKTKKDFARLVKEECKRVGIEIGMYAVGADFLNCSNGNLEAEIEHVKQEVDIANILGVKAIRHDATTGFPLKYKGAKSFDDALPTLIEGCKAVTEYANQYGIKTMVENHGFFCQDSDRIEKLINGVNHQNFGLLLDIGNFVCVDELPEKAVGKLIPYAFHIHIKDFHIKSGMAPNPGTGWFKSRSGNYLRGSIIGHGDVPVLQCLNIIKNSGYNGTLSIEFEGIENPILGVKIGLENLRKYLSYT